MLSVRCDTERDYHGRVDGVVDEKMSDFADRRQVEGSVARKPYMIK
jgi:hypothetical protein